MRDNKQFKKLHATIMKVFLDEGIFHDLKDSNNYGDQFEAIVNAEEDVDRITTSIYKSLKRKGLLR